MVLQAQLKHDERIQALQELSSEPLQDPTPETGEVSKAVPSEAQEEALDIVNEMLAGAKPSREQLLAVKTEVSHSKIFFDMPQAFNLAPYLKFFKLSRGPLNGCVF